MRVRLLILPALLAVVACSQPNQALRVMNNLTPHSESVADQKLEDAITFDECLNLPGLLKHIQDGTNNEVTVYIRNLELDKTVDLQAAKFEALDSVQAASQQIFAARPALIETFAPKQLLKSELLQDYLAVKQGDCSAVKLGDTKYTIQNLKGQRSKSVTVNRRRSGLNNPNLNQNQNDDNTATTTTKVTKSPTRFTLDLMSEDGTQRIIYKEGGGVLSIVVHTLNPALSTCTEKNVQTVTTKEIVVQHEEPIRELTIKTGFYQLLTSVLDSNILTADLKKAGQVAEQRSKLIDTRSKVPVVNRTSIPLDYSQLASLSNAVQAGLFAENKCK